ncbi:MAG: DNA primase [Desulfobacterales bacterium]|nr:DNA primase [Desulfobacterales bacterium]
MPKAKNRPIPEEKISDIKNAADIVEIVSESVLLKKAGRNYTGLCPFHSEKTPSFTVSPEKQIFYCFGCGEGGNVFSFLMKQDGIPFPEAVRTIAGRYRIEIPDHDMSPEQERRIRERESLFSINRQAMEYFRHALLDTPAGKKAMAYLDRRKITKEIIDDFNLGYAPDGWDNLLNHFLRKKTPAELLEKSGVVVPKKERKGFDRFRNRIIFPIIDIRMQVIGFGGRVMDESVPKYLNSPETPLYNKSRSLYGLHKTKQKCRERGEVYIVEGYFDLLSLYQHGIENVAATLGTSLTSSHAKLLKGCADRIILVYDSDQAGVKAAQRSIEIFEREEMDARIIVLPEGYDPDSFVTERGHDAFMNASGNALSTMGFLTESAVKKHGLSVEGKMRIISDMEKPLSSIRDSVKRTLYIRELADRTEIDETELIKRIRNLPSHGTTALHSAQNTDGRAPLPRRTVPGEKTFHDTWTRLEHKFITMMIQFPGIIPEVRRRNLLSHFRNQTLKFIGEAVSANPDKQASDIIAIMDDEKKKRIVIPMTIQGDDFPDREACLKFIRQFDRNLYLQENKLLQKQAKNAQIGGNEELAVKLFNEKLTRARQRQSTSQEDLNV